MSLRYLLDEHVSPSLKSAILTLDESVTVESIGAAAAAAAAAAPSLGTLDPQILVWCDDHGFVLVTNNRRSMPAHLSDHLMKGGHVPGIFTLNPKWGLMQTAEHLVLVAHASFDGEYADQIRNLPIG